MRILALIGALAIIGAIGAAIFFFGGYYSVAEVEDTGVVAWALDAVRAASVARHASDAPAPASRTARAASRSSSDPGKVMTPIRTNAVYFPSRAHFPREPKGRGVAWTEERGTSDEGRRRLKGGPEASEGK